MPQVAECAGERCPNCGKIISPPLEGREVRIDRQKCYHCGKIIRIVKEWEEPKEDK